MIIGNILQELILHEMKEPDNVCKCFTSKQMKKEITAGSRDVYLRFYASFIRYLHQNLRSTFPLESYNYIGQRIHSYVNHSA